MPSIMTHYWFAMEVLDRLPENKFKDTLKNYAHEYRIGSNGPDMFFYCHAFPWDNQKLNEAYSELGSKVHAEHINDFYHDTIQLITAQNDPVTKEAMISYVAGHLCHWALDSVAHPFIYYRTDGNNPETKYWHSRYEGMIDNYMMDYLKRDNRNCFPARKILDCGSVTKEAIYQIYGPIVHHIWDIEISKEEINKALHDFRSLMTFVYDPIGILYHLFRIYELIKDMDWKYTCHFITGKKDDTIDVFNDTHQKWCNPCDSSDVHHESLWDLFEKAQELCVKVLESFEKAIDTGNDKELLMILQNRSYNTGYSTFKTQKYFNSIY